MEFSCPAKAFHPDFGSRTASGRVAVTARTVRFESDAGAFALPLAALRIRLGGNNSAQVFFEHPEFPHCLIYTSDRRILEHEVIRHDPALAGLGAGLRSRRGLGAPLAVIGTIVVGLAVLLGIVLSSKARVIRYLAFQVPSAWETNLGDSVFADVKRQGKVLSGSSWDETLDAVTSRLRPVVAGQPYEFRFHIFDDTNVNAFALPGGNVVVLTGLLNSAQRPEEIAGVLAHEIAHVTERHSLRKIIDTAGLSLLIRSVFGDTSGLLSVIGNSSEFLLRQKYSRDFEREADDVGWNYLIAAQIDPRGLTEFFGRLLEREKVGVAMPGLISTHPASEERIRRLEAKWESANRKSGLVPIAPHRPVGR